MTPTQRQAMEMALEALETELRGYFGPSPRLTKAIEALRAALAERQPLFKPLIDQLPGLAEELAEQDDAVKAAWLAGYTEGEKAAWAEQADDKADAEIERLRSALCEIANADMTTKGFQMMAREALAGGPVAFGAA